MAREDLSAMRKDYGRDELSKLSVEPDPIVQFQKWFVEATKTEGNEANVFTLSTIGEDGVPEGRIVLLKFYAEDGFTFYTNYCSAKAKQMAANPNAAMTFFWRTQERQVRVKGTITKVDPMISDEYFNERPEGSRIGAWASPQSEEIPDRQYLLDRYNNVVERFKDNANIPRPDFWGGYLIKPFRIEFWQGRPSRLHDRIVYEKNSDGWQLKRLAP